MWTFPFKFISQMKKKPRNQTTLVLVLVRKKNLEDVEFPTEQNFESLHNAFSNDHSSFVGGKHDCGVKKKNFSWQT